MDRFGGFAVDGSVESVLIAEVGKGISLVQQEGRIGHLAGNAFYAVGDNLSPVGSEPSQRTSVCSMGQPIFSIR